MLKINNKFLPDGATTIFEIIRSVGKINLNATQTPVDIPNHKLGSALGPANYLKINSVI